MFTGIIEGLGRVHDRVVEAENTTFKLSCSFTNELKIDQSLAHNGVCLTVTKIEGDFYFVTAVKETLSKTNLSNLNKGDEVNLERCLQWNGRLDGHLVQGHVDTTATLENITDEQGSWRLTFNYEARSGFITVEKGSICVNGVSLTVINSSTNSFEVAIIPYTWENTNFKNLIVGNQVNLEFDILGKYISKLYAQSNSFKT